MGGSLEAVREDVAQLVVSEIFTHCALSVQRPWQSDPPAESRGPAAAEPPSGRPAGGHPPPPPHGSSAALPLLETLPQLPVAPALHEFICHVFHSFPQEFPLLLHFISRS